MTYHPLSGVFIFYVIRLSYMNKALARPVKPVVKTRVKHADGSVTVLTRKTDKRGITRRYSVTVVPASAR